MLKQKLKQKTLSIHLKKETSISLLRYFLLSLIVYQFLPCFICVPVSTINVRSLYIPCGTRCKSRKWYSSAAVKGAIEDDTHYTPGNVRLEMKRGISTGLQKINMIVVRENQRVRGNIGEKSGTEFFLAPTEVALVLEIEFLQYLQNYLRENL